MRFGNKKLEAGGGNRTRNDSLEDCGFTTKLHPQGLLVYQVLIFS